MGSFDLDTRSDGKWLVPGKEVGMGRPTQTANDWGTAWLSLP